MEFGNEVGMRRAGTRGSERLSFFFGEGGGDQFFEDLRLLSTQEAVLECADVLAHVGLGLEHDASRARSAGSIGSFTRRR